MDTWLKGNFPPDVYALDSLSGKRLFEQANAAPLPVQIRYLCEYWAADYSCYERVAVPVLAVIPSFSPSALADPARFYLAWYKDEWKPLAAKNSHIRLVTVEGAACNVMQDRPAELARLIRDSLD